MPKGDNQGIDWDSHRRDAQVEDVLYLVAHGSSLELACARVGVTVDAVEKRRERATLR